MIPDDPTSCVIFDLDGTLANVEHRLHHVRRTPPDWDAFFAACGDDPPNEPVVGLFEMISRSNAYATPGVTPFIVSGRPESTREATALWLTRQGIYDWNYEALLMRPDGDHRPDHVLKAEILANIRGQGYEPLFAVDDRPSVVRMWRAHGVPCFACDDAQWRGEATTGHGPAVAGKTLLTLMVGPSGAGKSEWLNGGVVWLNYTEERQRENIHGGMEKYTANLTDPLEPRDYDIYPSHVLSSDQFRRDLCGDWTDQSHNAEVFAALHDVAHGRLRHGLPTVIDATHLRQKDRLAAAALAPEGTRVRYVVMDRPLADKLRDRREAIPEHVTRKHDQMFKPQLADILAGDHLPNVDVVDLRQQNDVAAGAIGKVYGHEPGELTKAEIEFIRRQLTV